MTQTKDTLSSITSKGNNLPARIIVHSIEGWGKTSLGAMFPDPVFLQARGETGLETLIDSAQLPETPHFPETMTWQKVMDNTQDLLTGPHNYKTYVLDTANGLERLCHESVCRRDYRGKWGKDGFASYQEGFGVALDEWRELLTLLDRLRADRGIRIILLSHTKIFPFKNPEGPDYDRYTPDLHHKTWGLTARWSDVILFGNYFVKVQKASVNAPESQRGKGKGGTARVVYTRRSAAYDAKNRHGLPEMIDCGNSPQEAYSNFVAAIMAGKQKGKDQQNA